MKLYLRITLTVMSGVSLAGLLTGCAMPTKEDIARSTTEFNLVAEKAGNEMLLLNIIRASKRRPMYFTSIGKLTGNMTFEYGTGGVSIPFGRIGGGLNGSYSIAPSASYKNSPLFDLSVLNTKEFTNGIMTPVPMKTIEYYWSQGWPKEMLLHLFIRRIEIIDPNYPNSVKTYVNDPEGSCEFKSFQEQIRTKNWKWDIIEEVKATSIGEVDANEASKLQNLIEVQKAGLTLKQGKENDKMDLYLSQVNYVFRREATKTYKKAARKKITLKKIPEEKKKLEKRMLEKITLSPRDSRSGNKDNELQITVYLRSPEAILYYLGEILRVEIRAQNKGEKDPNVPKIYAGHGECKASPPWLFYACEAKRCEYDDPCVSVDYEGTRYVIPGTPDFDDGYCIDRSMHVLSLVSQLIGLQKTSEETPATTTVSVIGR